MIARLAPLFRRWIEHAKNMTLLGAAAAGCAYGYAYAVSPTVDAGRDFAGSVTAYTTAPAGVFHPIYNVPAGRQYTLTDIIVTNLTTSVQYAQVFIANGDCAVFPVRRMELFAVPPQGTVHLPLVTGIGFGAGKTVCGITGGISYWNLRGYLSNDA